MFDVMQQHFWLICGLWCGGIGGLGFWLRLRRHLSTGKYTKEEMNRFVRNMALWFMIPCALLWMLQMSLGAEAKPFFIDWPSPQRHLALAIQLGIWLALLYWIFFRDGTQTLSVFAGTGRVGRESIYRPAILKLIVVAVVVAGIFSLCRQYSL